MKKLFQALAARFPRWTPDRLWLWANGIVPTLILLGAFSVWRADPPVLVEFRNRVFDQFNRAWPRRYEPAPAVRIVDIDDASLAKVGQWPWPRTVLAELVARLANAGAGAIAFDAVFPEYDRTSPARIAGGLPKTDEFRFFRERLKTLPDHDRIFADIVAQAPVVTGFPFTESANQVEPAVKARILTASKLRGEEITADELERRRRLDPKFKIELDIREPVEYLPEDFSGAAANVPELEAAARGNGSFNALPDSDNIIRRVPLVYGLRGKLYPSLVLESLRVLLEGRGFLVTAMGASRTLDLGSWNGIQQVSVLKNLKQVLLEIPTDPKGNIILYDTGHRPERFIPAWRVLAGEAIPGLEGAVALVGTSAAGLKDQRGTPLNATAAGVEVHAQIAEQVLKREYLRRPAWAPPAEGLFLIVFGLAVILALPRLGAAPSALLAGGSIAGAFFASWHAYTREHLLLDPVYPALTVLAIYIVGTLINYLRTESEKRHVRGAFSRYMSPALVEQLAADPAKLVLGGELREMTLMFSDIRGFTTISEQFDAHGLTAFINRYLTPMTEIVLEKRGTIDKYMGDCIMAFWNAPLEDNEHVRHALEAALAMNARLRELNARWEREAAGEGRKHVPIHAGIGLNTGDCCVGNMGSDQRFDYSVLGDEVNLASRLEGQSKNYGVEIVIGPKTREKAGGEFAALELDLIKVKGKTVPVNIYTVLGGRALAESPEFLALAAKHAGMLSAYRAQRWGEAESLLAECRALRPELGKFYHLYEERIAACRASPPGADWNGVFTATSK